jgi:hypothetical protein
MAKQAQDTFVAELKDGTIRRVTKGEVLPDRHELVKRDLEGSGTLFRDLDLGEDEKPPAKSDPDPDEKEAEPVKAAARPVAKGKAASGG